MCDWKENVLRNIMMIYLLGPQNRPTHLLTFFFEIRSKDFFGIDEGVIEKRKRMILPRY